MARQAAMLSTAFLAVLLVMMEAASMAFASSASVNIYNDIQGSSYGPIQVDCSKGTHRLAPQSLEYGQKFGWGFSPSRWKKTKYFCQFAWGMKLQTVRVWVDSGPCDRVEWHVRSDGFYRTCPNSEFGDAPVLRRVDMTKALIIAAAIGLMALLVVMESASTASASAADVNIYNMLTEPIELHCQSGNRDLKPMTLQGNSQYFGWGFSPSIWGRTLYYCSFKWGSKHQKFDVWSEKNQMCVRCLWLVRVGGFFRTEREPILLIKFMTGRYDRAMRTISCFQ